MTFKPRRAGDELAMSRLAAARASGLLGTCAGEYDEDLVNGSLQQLHYSEINAVH